MKIRKTIGWLLLAAGVVIIFGALYFSYRIFTNKAEAPEIFKAEEKTEASSREKKTTFSSPSSPEELQKEMKKIIEEQIKEIIPSGFLNLISWSIFAGILIFGGSKIAGIGVKLIRGD